MSDGLDVSGGEFYHVQIKDKEALFKTQDGAVEYLSEHKDEIDMKEPSVHLARVETGDEWAIEGLPWQNIALQLL